MKRTQKQTDCCLDVVTAKEELRKYMKQFDDCTLSTQQAYLMDILNFLSFMQQNYQHANGHLVLSESRVMDWMKAMAVNRRFARLIQIILTVAHFMEALTAEQVICANPFTNIKRQFGKCGWAGIGRALLSSDPKSSLEAMRTEPRFTGCFGRHAQAYLDLHRAAGNTYRTNELALIDLNRFLQRRSIDSLTAVTTEVLHDWLRSMTCGAGHRRAKLLVVRRLFLHLRRLGAIRIEPVTAELVSSAGRQDRSFIPYIFSADDIRGLLAMAKKLCPATMLPHRPTAMYTVIGLMYTLGLRSGEVLSLKIRDIDTNSDTLFIPKTKFYKERLIPFGPNLRRCLTDYLEVRRAICSQQHPDDYVFANWRRKPITATCIRDNFKILLAQLGIGRPSDRREPRLHDLRHTFAVHRLLQWYQEGADVQKQLVLLSTFMGHFNIYSTQVYLTITDTLLHEANTRFHRSFGAVFDKEKKL